MLFRFNSYLTTGPTSHFINVICRRFFSRNVSGILNTSQCCRLIQVGKNRASYITSLMAPWSTKNHSRRHMIFPCLCDFWQGSNQVFFPRFIGQSGFVGSAVISRRRGTIFLQVILRTRGAFQYVMNLRMVRPIQEGRHFMLIPMQLRASPTIRRCLRIKPSVHRMFTSYLLWCNLS